MDIADEAFEAQEEFIQFSIMNAKLKNIEKLKPKGECYFCHEKVTKNKLFCNNICADKYERMKRVNTSK